MGSENIIDVSESTFEFEVINYSQTTPVVVDFWASWCIPCRVLSPILEKMANEGEGAFRLARVDVDESPNLAKQFNVRSIPAVKAFNHGQIVSEFAGALPEPKVKDFLRALVPTPGDLLLEKANSLLKLHQWNSAEKSYRQFLDTSSDNAEALLGEIKSLLAQGQWRESQQIIRNFPASPQYNQAVQLTPLAEAFSDNEFAIDDEDDALEAAYRNNLRLAARGNILAAIDGLLDILRQNKHFHEGQIRQVVLGLLSILGEEDPQTRSYRNELASILF